MLQEALVKPIKEWLSFPIVLNEGIVWTTATVVFGGYINGLVPHMVLVAVLGAIMVLVGPVCDAVRIFVTLNKEYVISGREDT